MVRIKVLLFLARHPDEEFSAQEISYRIKSSPENVLGALTGYGKRYSKALSLLSLGLVLYNETKTGTGHYRITAQGIEFALKIKDDSIDTSARMSFVCVEEDGVRVIRSRLEW